VYVRDERTGRQALLWNHHYESGEFVCEDVPPDYPMLRFLPEGSRRVRKAGSLPIFSPALPGQALHAGIGFYVWPEGGQEGVAEADKLWRVAGGDQDNYGDHDSFFHMLFDDDTTEDQLASLVRGLLDP
jgi:hypothetical protein